MKRIVSISFLCLLAIVLSCSTYYLKKCDNDYSYSNISLKNIYYSKPIVKQASITFDDRCRDTVERYNENVNVIRNDMYNYLVSTINQRGLKWKPLDDEINNDIHKIKLIDTIGDIKIEQEIIDKFDNLKIEYILVIYDLISNQNQSTEISGGMIMNSNGVFVGNNRQQTSFMRLDFTYKLAILDIKNKKQIMFINLRESTSKPLNFYDKVCNKLIEIILKTKKSI